MQLNEVISKSNLSPSYQTFGIDTHCTVQSLENLTTVEIVIIFFFFANIQAVKTFQLSQYLIKVTSCLWWQLLVVYSFLYFGWAQVQHNVKRSVCAMAWVQCYHPEKSSKSSPGTPTFPSLSVHGDLLIWNANWTHTAYCCPLLAAAGHTMPILVWAKSPNDYTRQAMRSPWSDWIMNLGSGLAGKSPSMLQVWTKLFTYQC